MKFLVTGSAGLIGRQVVKDLLALSHETYSGYHNMKPEFGIPISIDLTNFDNIIDSIEKIKPNVIIHLAALTNVDLCETEKELAMRINAKATEVIAKESTKNKSFLIYVSTDYIFDGERQMKKEDHITSPVDYYGKSKLEGEIAVKSFASNWCIARTSTPFGIHSTKKSFPLFVAENLQIRKNISVVTDQYTSPTYVPNLSKMIIDIASRQIVGILHVAGATRISRYDMATMVADKLNLDKVFLKPISINEMNWTAKRPRDSSLDVKKATAILREKPLAIDQSLDYFIQEIKSV